MGSLSASLLLVVFLLSSSEAQNVEDFILSALEAIMEAQQAFSGRLDEMKTKQDHFGNFLNDIKSTLEEQDNRIDMKMEDLRVEYQQCARRSQVDTFQNMFATEQQEILSSLKQCPCKDQISDFQDLLATDECDEGSHNCSEMADCADSVVLYKCSCLPGYSGDGFSCQDIDECSENTTCGVNEVCSNHPGNYSCNICQEGYKKEGNTIPDIDECASGIHECHNKANCTNTIGSYSCQCHPLYAGDGHTCDPVCEYPSLELPSLGCITLFSSKGELEVDHGLDSNTTYMMRWTTSQEKCKKSGRELIENFTKEDMELLGHHFLPLMGGQCCPMVGVKHSKWIGSSVHVSQDLWYSGQPEGGEKECGYVDLETPGTGLFDIKCSWGVSYALCQLFY